MQINRIAIVIAIIGWALSSSALAQVSTTANVRDFHVRYKPDATAGPDQERLMGAQRALTLSAALGESLAHLRSNPDGSHVLRAGHTMTRAEAWTLAEKLAKQTGVQRVEALDPDFDARLPVRPVGASSLGGQAR